MLKTLPIGVEDLKEIIEKNGYYVDKTLAIEELLKNNNKVALFPRPRRFGKTLFISMLDNFFNIEKKEDNKDLFKGLNIYKSEYYKYFGLYPVIKLNFKDLKQDNFEIMYNAFKEMIREIYESKRYLTKVMTNEEEDIFNSFLNKSSSVEEYQKSIKFLSSLLYKYYNKKVIILIDEYDVPIQQGYLNNFYNDIVSFIREVFSSALKGNEYLEMSIMTGVLRISKESLFSDLNNVMVYSIINKGYNEYFGFTSKETKELLNYYDLELNNKVKEMYDGYNFNGVDIYNPWSILNYAYEKELVPYWINTSGNELIMNLIKNTSDNVKITIEKLIQKKEILFAYDEKVTFLDLNKNKSMNMIINFFLQSGYLTLAKGSKITDEMLRAVIPNDEIKNMFANMLNNFLIEDNYLDNTLTLDFRNAFLVNDKFKIENILNDIMKSVSFYDTKENFYHGYMLGLFTYFLNNSNYILKSNREAGSGRFDIMIITRDRSLGIIIELKIVKNDMEKEAVKALKQMKDKEYYKELELENVREIYEYAIVFKGKKCIVR